MRFIFTENQGGDESEVSIFLGINWFAELSSVSLKKVQLTSTERSLKEFSKSTNARRRAEFRSSIFALG